MGYRFPIARKLWKFAKTARRNWLDRHRVPFNFWIHMLGIPLAVAGVVLMWNGAWRWGLAALVGGYALQYVGHRVEGNDVGEFIPLKKLLGLPYVSIAPQFQEAERSPAPRS